MQKFRNIYFASLLLLAAAPAIASEDYRADLADIRDDIAAIEDETIAGDGSLVGALRPARLEMLKTIEASLEDMIRTTEAGGEVEIVTRRVDTDPKKAARLVGEIEAQMEIISRTEEEAGRVGGLTRALTMSRLETEKLTLAGLRAAWMQVEYGLPLPVVSVAVAPKATADSPLDTDSGELGLAAGVADRPPWADPDHPEIDYTEAPYPMFAEADYSFMGQWAIEESQDDLDDSDEIWAVNVSQWMTGGYTRSPSFNMGCVEDQPRLIYSPDDYLLTDRNNRIAVDYRLDDAPPVSSRWSATISSNAAGLFGTGVPELMRKLMAADSLFIRFTERDGERHESRFDLAGTDEVVEKVAALCGFSTIDLSRSDLKQIQELLNAAGFSAGAPDGIWGAGSQSAMRAFQETNSLEVTGSVTRETLRALGLE